MNKRTSSKKIFTIFSILPALVLFLTFMVAPTAKVFWMSLFKQGGLTGKNTFVGLQNFKILLDDKNFIKAFENTVLLLIVVTIITMVLSIALAAILSRENIKFKNFFRIIFYLPNILSVVVISSIFSAILDPNQGILNVTLKFLNLESLTRMWLGDQKVVIWCIAFAMIWQAVGYYMVMYSTSMCSIPESLYEAADLEGASKIRQFFLITLPLIWDTVRTTLTFFIISTINLSFLFVKVMTGGGPDGASEVFLSYMYKQAYTNSAYGYGMAIGVIIFIFSFAISMIINKLTKREIIQY